MENVLKKKEIHVFNRFGRDLAYDVNHMHLFEINRLTREIFEQVEGKTPDQLAAALSDRFPPTDVSNVLGQLMRLNLVSSRTTEPGKAEPGITKTGGENGIKRLVLFVSQDCNLECRYCFTRGSGNIKKKNMSEAVARAAVDLIFRESNNAHRLKIGFYGGEPMLRFDLIKKIIPYADQKAGEFHKTVDYTMTTNGTLLTDEAIRFLVENRVQTTVSIDGSREIHDENRVFPDGSGSFDRVFPAFKKLKGKAGDTGTISVVHNFNRHLKDITQSLLNLGIPAVGLAPAISTDGQLNIPVPDNGHNGHNNNMDSIDIYGGQYEELVQTFLDNGKLFSEKPPLDFTRIFGSLEKREKRETNCGAAYSRIAVDADGNILPCDNLVGVSKFYMGNVLTGIDKGYQETFKGMRAAECETCRACWARHLCGGWCPFFSYNKHRDLKKPVDAQCRISKNHFEIALGVYSIYKKKKKTMTLHRGPEVPHDGRS